MFANMQKIFPDIAKKIHTKYLTFFKCVYSGIDADYI